VVEPNDMQRLSESTLGYLGEVRWMECPKDDAGFLAFLDQVLAALAAPEPTEPG